MTFTHQVYSEEDSERIQLANGTVVYLDIHGHLHRSDGPAIQCRGHNGTKEWWIRGFRHRDDGPAVTGYIGRSDHEEWWNEGVLHRDNGPAIDSNATGERAWYRHGKRHRDDGPAIERADGSKLWYRNGKLHRDDGPAIERADGEKFWFSDGEEQGHLPASREPEHDAGEDEVDEDLDIEPPSRGPSR